MRFGQNLWHFVLGDAPGKALGDRCLADAGLTDQQRIVLPPTTEDLDHSLDLVLATDQRIDLAFFGQLVQVLGELLERRSLLVLFTTALLGLA